jgi:DNA-directed RNA polymerase beta subunit
VLWQFGLQELLRMDIQNNNGATPERVDFSKISATIAIPNLIEVQKKSYERFLQMDLLPNERDDSCLSRSCQGWLQSHPA